MKNYRLPWFLCLLISISLSSCNLTRKTDVRIKSVTISPHSGSVGATFHVTVQFFGHNDNSDEIHCDETTAYDNVRVYTHDIGASDTRQTFTFQYGYNPGKHFLMCGTESGSSQAQPVGFTVVSGSEPQATQPPVDNPQAPLSDIKIIGTGTISGTNSWGHAYSVPATTVLLTIKPDNSAVLNVVYTMNVDFTQVQYMNFMGTADRDSETVTFTDCNVGGDSHSGGPLLYTRQPLSGEYSCIHTPKGGVQEQWKLKMP